MRSAIIEEIKQKVNCQQYMEEMHGAKIRNNRCCSFRPGADNPSSLLVYPDNWYDFATGCGGDALELISQDQFGGNRGEAIRWAKEHYHLTTKTEYNFECNFQHYYDLLDATVTIWQGMLTAEDREYLHARGLTDETIKACRIGRAGNPCEQLHALGFDQSKINNSGVLGLIGRRIFPYCKNGRAVYMIGRKTSDMPDSEPKYKKLLRTEESMHPIWGTDTLRREGPVIVAEGMFDALSFMQEGYAVVSAITGAFSSEQKPELFALLADREVIMTFDADPISHAGAKFTEKVGGELFEKGINVNAVFLTPCDGKKVDINELYTANPKRETLQGVLDTAVPWWQHITESYKTLPSETSRQKAMSDFLTRCSVLLDPARVAYICSKLEKMDIVDRDWLRAFAKSLGRAPSEMTLVKLFTEKYDCVYHPGLQFYQYDGGYWQQRDDAQIKRLLIDLLGRYATNRLVTNVHGLLKSEVHFGNRNFDQDIDLINFPSGMYHISTGKVTEHSRTDYSTLRLPYDFNPEADCPRWKQFIDEITNSDLSRHNLIQEMFGYCFLRNASFQKCFCLTGTGANGKSVLLNILEALVGKDHCSHVEPSHLVEHFQRILLCGSLVNLANDMKSDVSGAESYLKAIVAGDATTGCFKNRDFVTFTPFCKMVFACNTLPTTRDIDRGFIRRFMFIKFPVTFNDDPKDDNERKIDYDLQEKLMAELPGIFNWSMDGLRALLANKRFTVTADQVEMTRDLEARSNPIIDFVDEEFTKDLYSFCAAVDRSRVYTAYTDWCKANGYFIKNAKSFWGDIRQKVKIEEYRSGGSWKIKVLRPVRKNA